MCGEKPRYFDSAAVKCLRVARGESGEQVSSGLGKSVSNSHVVNCLSSYFLLLMRMFSQSAHLIYSPVLHNCGLAQVKT